MQPPPRKGTKAAFTLRAVHGEQLSKLQAKHQQECDLLDDLRNFTKQRSAIEKTYAESLLKLSLSFLQKKIPTLTEIKSEDGQERRTVYALWRTLLDENEKLAKARLAAADVYHHQISESAKAIRLNKIHTAKKCFEHIQKVHEELQISIREMDKTKKIYFEEEHVAHDAREKANDADDKLKRKKGNLFQSIASMQKNSAKFSTKREACDIKATAARNEYLLNLWAANAHQSRYYDQDLPEFIRTMDSEAYEKVTEYIMLLSRTELLTCAANQASYNKILGMAEMNTRQYNLDCFLNEYPIFKDVIKYQFEPCDDDKIDCLDSEHHGSFNLSKEARKAASKYFKEQKNLKDNTKLLRMMLCQQATLSQKHDHHNDQTFLELEDKVDEVRQIIRRAETSILKTEVKLDSLRAAGVNVDEWLKSSDSEAIAAMDATTGGMSRSPSQVSIKTIESANIEEHMTGEVANDSFYDSDFNDASSDISAMQDAHEMMMIRQHGDDSDSNNLTNGGEEYRVLSDASETAAFNYLQATVLYNYEAQNPDELSIFESEVIEIIGEGDGDGWVKARNEQGDEGYIPQNYVEIEGGQAVPSSTIEVAPVSFSSVDYHVPVSQDAPEGLQLDLSEITTDPTSIITTTLTTTTATKVPSDSYCRALYDYEATCPEELSFVEGQVIHIIRKEVSEVDDGWWEGEVDGHVGLFPSLVVEMLDENDSFSPPGLTSPPGSAPPMFTPPPMPQYLLPPAQVIITQPTPVCEHPDDKPEQTDEADAAAPAPKSSSQSTAGFEIDISAAQRTQYHGQFSSSTDSEQNEHTGEEATYSELVSSPDTPKSRSPIHVVQETPVLKLQDDNANETSVDEDTLPSPPPPEILDAMNFTDSSEEKSGKPSSMEGGDFDSLSLGDPASSPSNATGDNSIETVVDANYVTDFADFSKERMEELSSETIEVESLQLDIDPDDEEMNDLT